MLQKHIKTMLAEQERDAGKHTLLFECLAGEETFAKKWKGPKKPIKFSITTMHCQCGQPNYTLIIASNPKCRSTSVKFIPGEGMQYFFSEIFACYNLLL